MLLLLLLLFLQLVLQLFQLVPAAAPACTTLVGKLPGWQTADEGHWKRRPATRAAKQLMLNWSIIWPTQKPTHSPTRTQIHRQGYTCVKLVCAPVCLCVRMLELPTSKRHISILTLINQIDLCQQIIHEQFPKVIISRRAEPTATATGPALPMGQHKPHRPKTQRENCEMANAKGMLTDRQRDSWPEDDMRTTSET